MVSFDGEEIVYLREAILTSLPQEIARRTSTFMKDLPRLPSEVPAQLIGQFCCCFEDTRLAFVHESSDRDPGSSRQCIWN